MSQLRILQFGATGQVATEAAALAAAQGMHLTALSRSDVELTDAQSIRAAILDFDGEIDAVINTAAYTAVDAAEDDADTAQAVNAIAPGVMAQAARARGVDFVHISTDYVFDGSKDGAYRESDPEHPLGVYGRTKFAGEQAVQEAHPDAVIMRTAWVFSPWGKNFLKTMVRLADGRPELRVVSDQHGCPTPAREIADAALRMAGHAKARGSMPGGIYHFAGDEATSWHGFAVSIFAELEGYGYSVPAVVPIPSSEYPTPAARPANSILDCSRVGDVFGIPAADWRAALKRDLAHIVHEGRKS